MPARGLFAAACAEEGEALGGVAGATLAWNLLPLLHLALAAWGLHVLRGALAARLRGERGVGGALVRAMGSGGGETGPKQSRERSA